MSPKRKPSGLSNHPRPRKKVIWVLTEGEVTEPKYIDVLRSRYRGVSIEIIKKGSPPKVLVDKARRYQSSNDKRNPSFDEIWCIFDVDEHPNIDQAIHEARDSGINIAISNPCFELWLVLHYQNQNRYIDRQEIQSLAKRLDITDGKGITPKAREHLSTTYSEAKRRAENLEKRHIGNGSKGWENPSSQVWKFVDGLALLAEVGDG